jgi:hypothetical protein
MVERWFEEALNVAETGANWHELALPCCRVLMQIESGASVEALNSHFRPIPTYSSAEGAIRLFARFRGIDEEMWKVALHDHPGLSSSFTGRGAFPVRWWPSAATSRAWAAEFSGTGHRLLRIGRDICCFLDREGPDPLRYLQRLLREILIHYGRSRGFLMVHAAVVASPRGQGLVILGEQNAGKTDMALRLCRQTGSRIVGVDRVLLGLDGRSRLVAVGLPFGLNVARESWAAIGVPLEAAVAAGSAQQGKVYVDQSAFLRLTGMPLCPASTVTSMLVLNGSSEGRLAPAELLDGLDAHCLYGTDPGYRHDWMGLAGDPSGLEPQREVLARWPFASLARASLALTHRAGDEPPGHLLELLL